MSVQQFRRCIFVKESYLDLTILPSISTLHHPARNAEIRDHNVPFTVEQNVSGLNISKANFVEKTRKET